MPTPRARLSSIEVAQLWADLALRLENVGLKSQPQVALKILELVKNPNSQLKEYAAIVRTDPALSGRLLKLANSAFFAQRKAVTSLDRACLLLGLERLKAMSLGFHLSRAATSDPKAQLSRKVWGQSVLRACIAAEVARVTAPKLMAEAFVVGLLMDCGLPLMPSLDESFMALWESGGSPMKLHRLEQEHLGFGHADVAAALAKSWRLPDVLLHPIAEHHTPPALPLRAEAMHRLHAIAYTVGMLDLNPPAPGTAPTSATTGEAVAVPSLGAMERVFALDAAAIEEIVRRATGEYEITTEVFKDVAAALSVDEALVERVQVGIVGALDDLVAQSLERRGGEGKEGSRFHLGGHRVELVRGNDGALSAFLYDSQGQRLLTHVFQAGGQSSVALREALALEPHPEDELEAIDTYIKAA